jgi:hypothetical protein
MPESSIAEVEKFLLSVMGFNRAFRLKLKRFFLPFRFVCCRWLFPCPFLAGWLAGWLSDAKHN